MTRSPSNRSMRSKSQTVDRNAKVQTWNVASFVSSESFVPSDWNAASSVSPDGEYYLGYEYADLGPSVENDKAIRGMLRVYDYIDKPILPIDDHYVHPDEEVDGLLVQYLNGTSCAYDTTTPVQYDSLPLIQYFMTDDAKIHLIVKRPPSQRSDHITRGGGENVALRTIRACDMQPGGKYDRILTQLLRRPSDADGADVAQGEPSHAAAAAGGEARSRRRCGRG